MPILIYKNKFVDEWSNEFEDRWIEPTILNLKLDPKEVKVLNFDVDVKKTRLKTLNDDDSFTFFETFPFKLYDKDILVSEFVYKEGEVIAGEFLFKDGQRLLKYSDETELPERFESLEMVKNFMKKINV